MAALRERYLELVKRVLLNEIYRESEGADYRKVHEGRVWPTWAHTMVGRRRLDALQRCVEEVVRDGVPGDLIEAGVWRGGCGILMKATLESLGDGKRRVVLADSFAGLPPPTPGVAEDRETIWHRFPQLAVAVETVRENFRRYDLLDERVEFVVGFYRDTMLGDLKDRRFALVRLDCDSYDATTIALEALYDGIPSGGFLLCDDYGDPNVVTAKKAVDDFRTRRGVKEPLEFSDHSGILWRKR